MPEFEGIAGDLEEDVKGIFSKKIKIGGQEIPLPLIIIGGIVAIFALLKLSGSGLGSLSPSGSVPTSPQGSAGLSGSSDSASGQATQDAQSGFSQQLSDLSQGFSDQLTTTQQAIADQTNAALSDLQNQVTGLQNQPLPQDTTQYANTPLPSDFSQGYNPYGDLNSIPLNNYAGDNLSSTLPINYPVSPITSNSPVKSTSPVSIGVSGNAKTKGFLQPNIGSTLPISKGFNNLINGFKGFTQPPKITGNKSGNAITNKTPGLSGLLPIGNNLLGNKPTTPKKQPTNPIYSGFLHGLTPVPTVKPPVSPIPIPSNPYAGGFFNPISIAPKPVALPSAPKPAFNPNSGGFFNSGLLAPKPAPSPSPAPSKSGNAISGGLVRIF